MAGCEASKCVCGVLLPFKCLITPSQDICLLHALRDDGRQHNGVVDAANAKAVGVESTLGRGGRVLDELTQQGDAEGVVLALEGEPLTLYPLLLGVLEVDEGAVRGECWGAGDGRVLQGVGDLSSPRVEGFHFGGEDCRAVVSEGWRVVERVGCGD